MLSILKIKNAGTRMHPHVSHVVERFKVTSQQLKALVR